MNIFKNSLLSMMTLVVLSGAAYAQDDGNVKTRTTDEIITSEQVPQNIMVTARKALPGAFFTRVTYKVKSDDHSYYRFDASQVGKYWVLVVRGDGEITEKYQSTGPVPSEEDS